MENVFVITDFGAVGDGKLSRIVSCAACYDIIACAAPDHVEPAAAAEIGRNLSGDLFIARDILNPDGRISFFPFSCDCNLSRQRKNRQHQ